MVETTALSTESTAGFQASYRVYCLLGDGESAEGSVWEAAGLFHLLIFPSLCRLREVSVVSGSNIFRMQIEVGWCDGCVAMADEGDF